MMCTTIRTTHAVRGGKKGRRFRHPCNQKEDKPPKVQIREKLSSRKMVHGCPVLHRGGEEELLLKQIPINGKESPAVPEWRKKSQKG